MTHDTIRRCQVEVKVRQGVVGYVRLACEAKVPHLALHNDLFVLLAIDSLRIDGFQELDGSPNALLQLLECRLVVLGEWLLDAAEALRCKLGGVAAGLDLVWEALCYRQLSRPCVTAREPPGRTPSCPR